MSHRLEPLLNPSSMAVIGASERLGSPCREIILNLLNGGFRGPLYAVNPHYDSVCGVPCHPDLEALPGQVEQVFIAVGDAYVEGALEQAIAHGARSATIISSLTGKSGGESMRNRLQARAREAGLLLMGGNTMGYYNFTHGTWACAFDTRDNHVAGGGITLITHSGSGLSGLIDCEERLDCNLAISTGQELGVRMDEYLDYALEQPATRVVGLFMETARDPEGLRSALEKACERRIPVVALKVGRTELSARLTESHSGALAGRDSAFQALFERYGVIRVDDLDEFTTALIMFNQPHPVAQGGLVALHDSGGERQLLVDLADGLEVPVAKLAPATVETLEARLDPGLPAINPLDAWSAGGPGYHHIMEDCMAALMADPNAALGAVVHDRAPDGRIYADYVEYLRKGFAASGKPVFLVANRQGTGHDPLVVSVTREGFPVLDGLRPFLVGARALMNYRDFLARPAATPPLVDVNCVGAWRERLDALRRNGQAVDEALALRMLDEFGIPAVAVENADSESAALECARRIGWPVALKTAEPGIVHKSDVAGVALNIADESSLRAAYADLASRLGPRVVVMQQVTQRGVEMVLGMVRDEQFGPIVMLGFGGLDLEAEGQVRFLMPPFDEADARRAIDALPGRRRLDAWRGRSPLAVDALCTAAARFSVMVSSLADEIAELDVNPVIVHTDGCVAVDAYLGAAPSPRPSAESRRGVAPIIAARRRSYKE